MDKADKKTATLSETLEVLNAALVAQGHSLPDLLVAVAAKELGLDLRRAIHPLEEVKV